MKKSLLVGGAIAALAAFGSGAALFAADAEVIKVTADMSPYLMGGSGLDAKNKAGKIYDLQEGATLCMTNSAGSWRIWTNVIATNGLAFISSTDAKDASTLELRGTLITGGEGRLGIKNFNKFITYVDFGSDSTTSTYPGDCVFDGAGLFFADADGHSRTGGKIFLEGGAVKTLPTDTNVTVNWGDPDNSLAHIVIAPDSQWKNDDPFTFPASDYKYALYVADDTSLKPGATVNVAAGCAFGVAAGVVSNNNNPFALTYRTTGNAFSNRFHVVLGENSTFIAASRVTDVSLGTIEGPGGVTCCCIKKDRPSNENYITSKFLGQNLYTGVTKIAGAYQRAEFGASLPPSGNYACDAYTFTQFSFYPAGHEDGGNAAVTINRLDAPYLANQILAAANQTVTVKKIVGKCSAYPASGDETSVVDFNPAIGPAVIRTNSKPNVLFNGKPCSEAGVVKLYKSGAGEILILLPDENGEGTPWSECSSGALWVNRPWLDVGDSQTFATQPTYAPLRAKNGTLTLKTSGQPVKTIVGPNATAKVEYTGNWRETAALWLDPDTSKLYTPGQLVRQEWIDSVGSKPDLTQSRSEGKYIEGLMDCRGEDTHGEYMAFNDRVYDYVYTGKTDKPCYDDIVGTTHAVLSTREDGLKYINCHTCSSARLPLHKGGKDTIKINNEPAFAATMAIFVINSEKGGGAAVIGTQNASYARTKSATGPITSKAVEGDIWLDGKKVDDPTVTCLNGGWQILSIDVSKYPISGFGWDKRRSTNGGVDYGDIILFTNAVSAIERQAAEKYLANKWGITTYAPDTTEVFEVELSGSGAAELPAVGEVEVRGAFKGTATVAADSVVTIKNDLPWTEADIPTDGLLNWFDPNDAASFKLKTEEGSDTVMGWCDRGTTFETIADAKPFIYSTESRRPFRRLWQRGCGPLLNWIDYEHAPDHKPGSSDGNALRLKAWQADKGFDGSIGGADVTVAGRTFFVVSDSFRGGGDVLRYGVSSAGSDFGSRGGCPKADDGIWKGAGGEVANGTTRLNGNAVATPKNTGFTGEPEVLSLCTKENPVAFGCIGSYSNTESQTDPVTGKTYAIPRFGYGEMVGEVLVYDKQLDDTVRANIEDYLMSKWIGYSPAGKTDWRGATIDGAGTVKAATLGIAPKMASTFAGTLALSESEAAPTYEVTISAFGVSGGLVAPAATLTHNWTGTPKLNVTVTDRAHGTFKIVDLKAISPNTTWDVTVTGTKCTVEVTQSADGSVVTVNLIRNGMILIVR